MFSTELDPQLIGKHAAFDASKSATFKKATGSQFRVSYGDGSGAAGIVGTDTVTIGGVKVENQVIELANDVSQSFVQDVNTDGLVGLAFSQLNSGMLSPLLNPITSPATTNFRNSQRRHQKDPPKDLLRQCHAHA